MATHRMYHPTLSDVLPGSPVEVLGEEAQHAARVKRLGVGDRVELLSGRGLRGIGAIADIHKARSGEWALAVNLAEVRLEPKPVPHVEVWASPPKGERLEWMIDQLSQVGVAVWRPLITERTIVEPRQGKLDRLHRIAIESMKQCGRAWVMEIGEAVDFAAALMPMPDVQIALAHAGGGAGCSVRSSRLLVGPEGGWSVSELARAADAKVAKVGLGRHVLRTETATVVGATILINGFWR